MTMARILAATLTLFLLTFALRAQNTIQTFPSSMMNSTDMVSPGDVNADGVADLAIVSPSQGLMALHSGLDGSLLFSFATGLVATAAELAVVDDMDGDGLDDLALGLGTAALNTPVADVKIFSSANGNLLQTIPSFQFACGNGYAIDRIFDLDGDGVAEIAIGAPFASTDGFTFNGSLRIHSGATGAFLAALDGVASQDCFSIDTALVRDEDADLVPDLVVASLPNGGRVQLFSGATLALVSTFDLGGNGLSAASVLQRPIRLCGDVDIDGDGAGDHLVAKWNHDPSGGAAAQGAVFVVETGTSSLVYRFDGAAGEGLGRNLDLGDFNGDGSTDLAVARTAANVVVYSGLTGDAIWQTPSGFATLDLATIVSVDADSIPDLAVLAATSTSASKLEIFAGGAWLGQHGRSHVGTSSLTEDVLTISGSVGGEARRVEFAVGEPFSIELAQPSTTTAPADFALFGRLDSGLETEFFDLGDLGSMAFHPAPAATWAIPYLFTLAASVPQGGGVLFTAPPTPFALGVPFGMPQPLNFTLQAVVVQGPAELRVTNAIIISVK